MKLLAASCLATVLALSSVAEAGVAGNSYSGTANFSNGNQFSSCMAFDPIVAGVWDNGSGSFPFLYSENDILLFSVWSYQTPSTGASASGFSFLFGLFTTWNWRSSNGSLTGSGFYFLSTCDPLGTSMQTPEFLGAPGGADQKSTRARLSGRMSPERL